MQFLRIDVQVFKKKEKTRATICVNKLEPKRPKVWRNFQDDRPHSSVGVGGTGRNRGGPSFSNYGPQKWVDFSFSFYFYKQKICFQVVVASRQPSAAAAVRRWAQIRSRVVRQRERQGGTQRKWRIQRRELQELNHSHYSIIPFKVKFNPITKSSSPNKHLSFEVNIWNHYSSSNKHWITHFAVWMFVFVFSSGL